MGDGDGVHVRPGGELLRELGDDLLGGRVAHVLELGHRPAAVVVADDAGEGHDGSGGLVGHGVLVLGHGQRRIDDAITAPKVPPSLAARRRHMPCAM